MSLTQDFVIDTTLNPRVDSRYFLASVGGVGWLVGIWLASMIDLSPYVWGALFFPCAIGAVIYWKHGRVGLVLAFCAALALGGWRYTSSRIPFEPAYLHYYNGGKDVEIWGHVVEEPAVYDTRVQLRVAVEQLVVDGQARPVSGLLQIDTRRFPEIPYGAQLRMVGDLSAPIALGSPDYAAYLERQGVLSVMESPHVEVIREDGGNRLMRTLLALKQRSRDVIATSLPEPHASLLTGILLGDSRGMPRELKEDFRETGMTHIIAISGFNIAVIIALLDYLAAPFLPRKSGAVAIMVFIGLYAILVGASASVVRASVMGVSYLIGFRLLGRPTLAIAGLFTAAFLMTLANPDTLWDIGFQLSFAATLGLMLYAGRWSRWFAKGADPLLAPEVRGRVTRFVSDLLLVTLAAQLLTLPLILYHFGRLSLASLPANILVLPAQGGVMAAGGLTLMVGLIAPGLGQLVGLIAWLFLNYTITVIRMLAQMSHASIPLPLTSSGLLAAYLVIGLITFLATTNKTETKEPMLRIDTGRRKIIAIAGLLLAGLLLIGWRIGQPDDRLRVAFLDVGQGDAIFIQTPNGRQLLIDGGRYPSEALDQLGRQLPFWDRSIDMVMVTHPDADHVAGLVDVIERYNVSVLLTNGADEGSDSIYAALLEAAGERGTDIHIARKGESILLDEGIRIDILHSGEVEPSDSRNDASVVARLSYGTLSVLLTGDAEESAEMSMLQDGLPVQAIVLKAGHHGANTSSSAEFLQAVAPRIVVISAGRDNSYGHPHPDMVARAAAVGAAVLRTDELGTLELESDGVRMWWSAEHDNKIAAQWSP